MRFRENIHNILAVFLRDMGRLVRNPIALVVTVGVCIMPSLYAWYTIEAQWDPYKNTEAIEVGVVNLDEGADVPGMGHLDVGADVVSKLKENDELGWRFVDEEEGMQRVASGEYYACIVIPKDFSADFASIAGGDFTKPELEYYVNEKLSGAAPKITDAGATALESEINRTFISTVTDVVMSVVKETGSSVLGKADDAENGLTRDLEATRDSIAEAAETLAGLTPTLDETESALDAAEGTFARIEEELPTVASDLDDARAKMAEIRESLAAYSSQASEKIASGLSDLRTVSLETSAAVSRASADMQTVQGSIEGALAQAKRLLETDKALVQALEPYAQDNADIAALVTDLKSGDADLSETVNRLSALSASIDTALSDGSAAAVAVDDAVTAASTRLQDALAAVQGTVVPEAENSLGSFSEALGTLRGVTTALEPAVDQAKITLASMRSTLSDTRDAIDGAADSLNAVQSGLEESLTDMKSLSGSQAVKELQEFLGVDDADLGDFLASPIELKTVTVFPVANYGSGVAPFFTNLALWVAGFILLAMLRLRVDPEGLPPLSITQAYFGRWLTFMVLGLFQGLICCLGDLALGIQCDSPGLFVLAGVLTALVNINLMYALAYAMKHVGKAIAVILLIVQIPGSSGMFPVEMMPAFFQAIHPWLPFTYSIDAMRQAIGGLYGCAYALDIAKLLLFVPLGLFIGVVLGRYAFNLNLLFDGKLAQTDLYVCEKSDATPKHPRFRIRAMMQALLNMPAYRRELNRRVESFDRAYPWLKRVGWALAFAQPIVTFAIMVIVKADIETKVVLMAVMVCGIIAVDCYLIVVDYLYESLHNRQRVADLSGGGLMDAVRKAVPVSAGGESDRDQSAPDEASDPGRGGGSDAAGGGKDA